jgi:hypothetical protein
MCIQNVQLPLYPQPQMHALFLLQHLQEINQDPQQTQQSNAQGLFRLNLFCQISPEVVEGRNHP